MDCSKDPEPPEAVKFMRLAVIEAKQALARLEVPVGCVIVQNGEVIGHGSNRVNETRNATRHAEMEAIDMILTQWTPDQSSISLSAPEQLKEKFRQCELYVTCEPCIMCAAALSILGVKKVYYGCANDRFGGCGSILPLHMKELRCYVGFMNKATQMHRGHIDESNYRCDVWAIFESLYGCRHSLPDDSTLKAVGVSVTIHRDYPICALEACMEGYIVQRMEDGRTVNFFVIMTGNKDIIMVSDMIKMKLRIMPSSATLVTLTMRLTCLDSRPTAV
ncbi:hypothetical protein R1sor_014713 [Riccia sorocarpa]|uniref:CMP/dCMP-type deaminase domain-containing protein n=1 Tax=Riccia sorocarpa TaxID=122646 RepID=A0ABD3HE14_9MARC